MMLGPRSETIGFIGLIPSLPIHSSVLFVLIVGLFLAALMIRARRLPTQSRSAGLTTRQARSVRWRVTRRLQRQHQGAAKTTQQQQLQDTSESEVMTLAREGTMSQHREPAAASGRAEAPQERFRVHWGRTLLAGTAVIALLAGLGTAVAALATSLPWALPALCAGVFVLSLVGLQVSAVVRRRHKRRRRVEGAIRDAMNTHPRPRDEVAGRQRSASQAAAELGITARSAPFDALSADTAGHGGPDSLVKLDEDGLPDTAERLFGARAAADVWAAEQAAASARQVQPASETSTYDWEPREVPHPKYLVAEKAPRPEPQPLRAPQPPAPRADTKLKQPAAPVAQPATESEATSGTADQASGQSIDLDEVLKRRRA